MKILVVDDEPLVRRSLSRALQAKGHEVRQAQDGAEGLLEWKSYDPDLVFLDVLMPKLSGPDVLKQISVPRRAKVILMSAYSGEQAVESNESFAAELFLAKPFEDIFEIVRRAEELMK